MLARPATDACLPMIPWLDGHLPRFPHPDRALPEPNGLLAAGGQLAPQWLLAAYSEGIFPWYSPGDPVLWWSPDPRTVLVPSEMRISRSLAKVLRNRPYEVRCDSAFAAVLQACAAPRGVGVGTWIVPEMQAAYRQLHALGYAHSIETWIDGELVGGLYGVALGRVFYGESMFSRVRDASKIALAHLARDLERRHFAVIDCQMETPHLLSLGARSLTRSDFRSLLARHVSLNEAQRWETTRMQDLDWRGSAPQGDTAS